MVRKDAARGGAGAATPKQLRKRQFKVLKEHEDTKPNAYFLT